MSMREKPITFCRELLPKVFDGSKTMTRRVVTELAHISEAGTYIIFEGDIARKQENGTWLFRSREYPRAALTNVPLRQRYQVGDLLWVREPLVRGGGYAYYKLDFGYIKPEREWQWKRDVLPGRFMPKWAARLWLKVTNVRVERLQDITPRDACEEGANGWALATGFSWKHSDKAYPVYAFQHLWNHLNAKRGYAWDSNPWVWVYTFERTR